MVMAKDMRNLQVTSCPTYSDLFEHFDKGLYKRIGDVARPDHALLHAILQEIRQGLMDRAWSVVAERDNLELALEGTYYVLAFVLALQGEEMPLKEL
jgi:hypothetical protein